MVTLKGIKKDGVTEYLRREDYYFKEGGGKIILGDPGESGVLTEERFKELISRRIEKTGGDKKGQDRVAEDICFSAPKSVSLVAALDKEARQKIFEVHQKAVEKAINYIHENKMIQVREYPESGGHTYPLPASGVIAARFDHFTSRNLDPQLHSHVLIVNRGISPLTKEERALYLREVYSNKRGLDAIYMQELAKGIKELGYRIEWNNKGSIEIKGFDEEQLKQFSTRREEIEQRMKELGIEGGKAAQVACLDTRQPKQEVNIKEIEKLWQEKAEKLEIKLPERGFVETRSPQERILDTLDKRKLIEEVVERQIDTAGFSQYHRLELDAIRELTERGIEANIDEIRQLVREVVSETMDKKGGMVELREDTCDRFRFTAHDVINTEIRSFSSLREAYNRVFKTPDLKDTRKIEGMDPERVLKSMEDFNKNMEKATGFRLSSEQQNAIFTVATAKADSVIIGRAGTGKTTIMRGLKEVCENNGKKIMGVSVTGAAAENLEKETGIRSFTVDSLAFKRIHDPGLKGGILVVDEAGMLDAKRDAMIREFAIKYDMKIVRVGDPDQLKPIGHSDPFKEHIKEAQQNKSLATLKEVFRQKDPEYKEIAIQAMYNVGGAFESLESRRWVKEISSRGDRIKEAVKEYVNHYLNNKEVLMVTETREIAHRLNKEARYQLQQKGMVKDDGIKTQVRNTQGKSQGERVFATGDRVVFLKNDTRIGVMNGSVGEITSVEPDKNTVTVKLKNGETKNIDLTKYNYIDYGYAITIHKSQGQTVDRVIYFNDTKKGKNLTTANSAYVALTRGREGITVYTGNFNELFEKIQESEKKVNIVHWQKEWKEKDLWIKGAKVEVPVENVLKDLANPSEMRTEPDKIIRQGVAEQAAREMWWEMSRQEKMNMVYTAGMGDLPEERFEKAVGKAGNWYPDLEVQKEEIHREPSTTGEQIFHVTDVNPEPSKNGGQNNDLLKEEHKQESLTLKENIQKPDLDRDYRLSGPGKMLTLRILDYLQDRINNPGPQKPAWWESPLKHYYHAIATGKDVGFRAFMAGKTKGDIKKDTKAMELAKTDKGLTYIWLRYGNEIKEKVQKIRAGSAIKKGDVWNAWKYGGVNGAISAVVEGKINKTIDRAIKNTLNRIIDKAKDRILQHYSEKKDYSHSQHPGLKRVWELERQLKAPGREIKDPNKDLGITKLDPGSKNVRETEKELMKQGFRKVAKAEWREYGVYVKAEIWGNGDKKDTFVVKYITGRSVSWYEVKVKDPAARNSIKYGVEKIHNHFNPETNVKIKTENLKIYERNLEYLKKAWFLNELRKALREYRNHQKEARKRLSEFYQRYGNPQNPLEAIRANPKEYLKIKREVESEKAKNFEALLKNVSQLILKETDRTNNFPCKEAIKAKESIEKYWSRIEGVMAQPNPSAVVTGSLKESSIKEQKTEYQDNKARADRIQELRDKLVKDLNEIAYPKTQKKTAEHREDKAPEKGQESTKQIEHSSGGSDSTKAAEKKTDNTRTENSNRQQISSEKHDSAGKNTESLKENEKQQRADKNITPSGDTKDTTATTEDKNLKQNETDPEKTAEEKINEIKTNNVSQDKIKETAEVKIEDSREHQPQPEHQSEHAQSDHEISR